ncbi:MAG: FAD-dependent oxidoreductase [Acidobacteria bacterium]|nr:FAD-dependent oxidoreductase [Acidobacteriota bacterium]
MKNQVGRRGFVRTAVAGSLAGTGSAAQTKNSKTYRETLATPVVARHQVVVAGGGPSGVIAAAAAARSGADTLLIERYAFLGGNGVAGLMTCYNGFRNQRPPEALQTVKGIPGEYIAELVRLGGVADIDNYERTVQHDIRKGDIPYTVGFDPEAAKIASLNLLRKDGVKMRLHSWVVAPMMDGARVTGVIVESKSGRQAIAAGIVIDCTGDGDIAALAGAPFMGPAAQGDRMPMSLMYRLGGVPSSIKGPYGGIRIGDRVTRWGPGFGGDGADVENLTRAEVETRLKLWDQVQEMKKKAGLESLYLLESATCIGVRETRRVEGEYTVTEKDAIAGTRFPDVIAISSNPMPSYRGKRYFFQHEGFDIPYRSLVPKKIEGLVLSGRCISCEQGPFQSARSMAPAMAVGHASGCAAALAAKQGVPPRKLDVKALQNLLRSQKAELRA